MLNEATTNIKTGLDKICNEHGKSKVIQSITNLKLANAARFQVDYGRFKDQFGVFFDVLNEVLLGVNYIPHDKWPDYRGLQFILITHNIKFINSAFEQLNCGLWEDTFVLARPAYEAFIRTLYISFHPHNKEASVIYQKDRKKRFNLTNFIKDELKLEWNDYAFYSITAHSNSWKVIKEYISVTQNGLKEPIAIRLKYEKMEIEIAINYLIFLGVVYLKMAKQLFADSNNGSLPKSLTDKADYLANLWQDSMKTHNKEYWPQVSNDITKIFDMIKTKEQSIDNLKNKVKNIVEKAAVLKCKHTNQINAPVNYACIFSQKIEEYEELIDLVKTIGAVVKETKTGPLFHIDPLPTNSGILKLLKIRIPDPTRLELGDADFTVSNFSEFEKDYLPKPGFKLINKENFVMIELMDSEFDVRAHFSNPPLDIQLNIK